MSKRALMLLVLLVVSITVTAAPKKIGRAREHVAGEYLVMLRKTFAISRVSESALPEHTAGWLSTSTPTSKQCS